MSLFFKALEQAELDRNGRQRERTSREPRSTPVPDATGAPTAPAVEVTSAAGWVPAGPRLESRVGSHRADIGRWFDARGPAGDARRLAGACRETGRRRDRLRTARD